MVACRGATAGSGTATTEIKIMMIDIIDGAPKVYPTVEPNLFVEDVSAEKVATEEEMVEELVGFTLHVSKAIAGGEVESPT